MPGPGAGRLLAPVSGRLRAPPRPLWSGSRLVVARRWRPAGQPPAGTTAWHPGHCGLGARLARTAGSGTWHPAGRQPGLRPWRPSRWVAGPRAVAASQSRCHSPGSPGLRPWLPRLAPAMAAAPYHRPGRSPHSPQAAALPLAGLCGLSWPAASPDSTGWASSPAARASGPGCRGGRPYPYCRERRACAAPRLGPWRPWAPGMWAGHRLPTCRGHDRPGPGLRGRARLAPVLYGRWQEPWPRPTAVLLR